MDPESRAVLEAVQSFKRKAPKLKTGDRTLSLAVDNYLPPGPSAHQHLTHHGIPSGLAIDPNFLIDNNLIIPPSSHGVGHTAATVAAAVQLSSPIQEFRKSNIFYTDGSNHSLNANQYHTEFTHPQHPQHPHPHTHQMSRKPNIRRSDTLDVYGAYEMRKANSFNSNEIQTVTSEDIMPMSRRTNSMRHAPQSAGVASAVATFPYELDDIGTMPAPPMHSAGETGGVGGAGGNTRRNCRMHKSFHDRSRQHEVKMEKIVDGTTIKCHSLGDDGADEGVVVPAAAAAGASIVSGGSGKRRLSPKFNSAESSLDNEVFHSRSSSRTKMESTSVETMDAIEAATSPTSLAAKKAIAAVSHKHPSSQSLDKPHHSFRRIARATQSFYLNPGQAEEVRMQQRAMHGSQSVSAAMVAATAAKRMHSASMRAKSFRDAVNEAKKSKSFVNDPYGVAAVSAAAAAEYELSPRRRESFSDIKKSPRLSGNDDYDSAMHAYRQNRRKSSLLSNGGTGSGGGGVGTGSTKKKGSAKKKSMDGTEMGIDGVDTEGGDTESTRKRKRIVCILVSLFLSLVFAGVFVVVFTFTYSSMTQVSEHTKRVYTFAPGPGNRDMPIHHHNGKYHTRLTFDSSLPTHDFRC